MLETYPEIAPLEVGEFRAFSPYAFMHHNMETWHPTQAQKEQAINKLPYIKDTSFIKLMHDKRSETSYAFIRTPNYYATFNSGKIVTSQQRYGLGLIWTPEMGTIFQSQSKSDEASWGTKAVESEQVYEASDIIPEFTIREFKTNTPFISSKVKYDVGANGEKSITFENAKIKVEIKHSGLFTELLPILVYDNDIIDLRDGHVKIMTKKGDFYINTSQKDGILLKDFESDSGIKKCKVIEITAEDRLTYEIELNNENN